MLCNISTFFVWYFNIAGAKFDVFLVNSRTIYRYGAKEARTDRLASLDKEKVRRRRAPPSIEDLIMGLLFFCVPYTYLERLESVWAERSVSLDGWQKFVTSLLVEWSDSNLLVSAGVFVY